MCQYENCVVQEDDETAGEESILTALHIPYLGDIPLAHVAVKFEGCDKHCEEREGACQD